MRGGFSGCGGRRRKDRADPPPSNSLDTQQTEKPAAAFPRTDKAFSDLLLAYSLLQLCEMNQEMIASASIKEPNPVCKDMTQTNQLIVSYHDESNSHMNPKTGPDKTPVGDREQDASGASFS